MKLGKLIIFLGPEGSGKSTHINLLSRFLHAQGYKVHKTRILSAPILVHLMRRIFVKLGYFTVRKTGEKFPNLFFLRHSSLGKRIHMMLELFSLAGSILIRDILPRFLGHVVIVERHVIGGSIVDLTYFYGKSVLDSFIGRVLLRLIPEHALVIYLYADYKTLKQRRGISVEPKQYINLQNRIYEYFSCVLKHFITINTSGSSIQENQELIRKVVLNYLCKSHNSAY